MHFYTGQARVSISRHGIYLLHHEFCTHLTASPQLPTPDYICANPVYFKICTWDSRAWGALICGETTRPRGWGLDIPFPDLKVNRGCQPKSKSLWHHEYLFSYSHPNNSLSVSRDGAHSRGCCFILAFSMPSFHSAMFTSDEFCKDTYIMTVDRFLLMWISSLVKISRIPKGDRGL